MSKFEIPKIEDWKNISNIEVENVMKQTQAHLEGLQRKKAILEKKKEECESTKKECDYKPLYETDREIDAHNITLAKLSAIATVKTWKPGDKVTVCGNLREGFDVFDFKVAAAKVHASTYGRGYLQYTSIAELEITEVKPDGRILAKSQHSKALYIGLPKSNDDVITFFPLRK